MECPTMVEYCLAIFFFKIVPSVHLVCKRQQISPKRLLSFPIPLPLLSRLEFQLTDAQFLLIPPILFLLRERLGIDLPIKPQRNYSYN